MADSEQLERLKRSVEEWNAWRREERFDAQPDLKNAHLGNAYLTDANLNNTDLRDADLSRAALVNTNLRDANLSGAVRREVT